MVDISSTCKNFGYQKAFIDQMELKKSSRMSHSFKIRKSRSVLALLVRSFINYIVSLHIFKKDNRYYVFHLHEVSKAIKFIETRVGLEERGKQDLCNGHRASALQENVLEICCTTMQICLILLNCIVKNGCNGKFYIICFYHNLK